VKLFNKLIVYLILLVVLRNNSVNYSQYNLTDKKNKQYELDKMGKSCECHCLKSSKAEKEDR